MIEQMAAKDGFIAALDQSGGSTPGALRLYGVADSAYSGDAEMFALMHAMRVRIMSAPAFTGAKVIAAILFERTMDGEAQGQPVPTFLWEDARRRPVRQGRQGPRAGDGRRQPDEADAGPRRAARAGGQARRVRHQDALRHQPRLEDGIAAIVAQQFEIGVQIARHGLMPIIEPEVSIKAPDKAGAEAILRDRSAKRLDALPADRKVMLKLTIPDVARFLFAADQGQARRCASSRCRAATRRAEACQLLAPTTA